MPITTTSTQHVTSLSPISKRSQAPCINPGLTTQTPPQYPHHQYFHNLTLGSTGKVHSISAVSGRSTPCDLLGDQYKQIFAKLSQTAFLSGEMITLPDLLVHHYIITNGSPVFAPPPRLVGGRFIAGKQELNYLLEGGIFRPPSS